MFMPNVNASHAQDHVAQVALAIGLGGVASGSKGNRFKRSGFARLCQGLLAIPDLFQSRALRAFAPIHFAARVRPAGASRDRRDLASVFALEASGAAVATANSLRLDSDDESATFLLMAELFKRH